MKTNKLWSIIMMLVIVFLSIAFVSSCSKDNEFDEPNVNVESKDEIITIQIDEASEVTANSAMLSASYKTKEGQPDKVGFIVGKSSDISIVNYEKNLPLNKVNSLFSQSVSGLQQFTTYYYKAYALYKDKYYYSRVVSFTTEKEKEAPAKISLVSRDGMSVRVKYEISQDVAYYYCGKGTNISKTTKYTAEKTFSYSELSPGKDYTFTIIAYMKDGQQCDPIRATFSTASSPYSNYLCIDGKFYPFSSMEMREEYDYISIHNTGTNWRYLTLYMSSGEYVRFEYGVHQWEYIDNWTSGTYNITNSSSYYTYNGYYYNGRSFYGFDEGSLTIGIQSGTYTVDFSCECKYGSRYIGHIMAK